MKLGWIGFGEAAWCMAGGLRAEGYTEEALAYDLNRDHEGKGPLIRRRAEETGVKLVSSPGELADWADVIIAAVPSHDTLDAAVAIAPFLREGVTYADVSAATPSMKRRVWETVSGTGARFADCAMMASLLGIGHRVPILACGNGAEALAEALNPVGFRIQVVEGEPGRASAIKLVRSIFVKGFSALIVEMAQAGEAYGVTDYVAPTIDETLRQCSFAEHMQSQIIGTAIHARRRADEVFGAAEMLDEAGIDSTLTRGTAHLHEEMAAYRFADREISHDKTPWREIILEMNDNRH